MVFADMHTMNAGHSVQLARKRVTRAKMTRGQTLKPMKYMIHSPLQTGQQTKLKST